MGFIYSPSIVTDGLVLLLDAANPKSYPGTGNTWFDISGNGLNFTRVGSPTWNSAGYFSNFSASNYFECNSATGWTNILPTGDSPRTICALVRRVTGVTYEHVLNYGISVTGQAYALAVLTSSGRVSDHRWGTSNSAGNVVTSGSDHFISSRYDTGAYPASRFQLNKEFSNGSSNNTNLATGTTTLRVGSRISTPTEVWTGTISYVMVYNRALSDSELIKNYSALRGRYGI